MLSTGTRIQIDSVLRPRSSSRGRNTSASVTVTVTGRPLFWNSISAFDFDVCIVIGMSFYICLPNFVVIGRLAAEL